MNLLKVEFSCFNYRNTKYNDMKDLIKKWESKLLEVQSDILDGKCPNLEMQFYKNGEQSVILELLSDLKELRDKSILIKK